VRGGLAVRIGIASTLAISGVIHAYLYIHGYQYSPTIGTAFLVQASVFCALALTVVLVAFAVLSRRRRTPIT
jgi:hypothetical protein